MTDSKIRPFMGLSQLDDSPIEYRIDNLLTRQGNVLISAYRKAGKTSLILDLLKALTSEDDFLGELDCARLSGPAVYVNLELYQAMLRKYCLEIGLSLDNKDALVQDYCGHAGDFMMADDYWRADYAQELAERSVRALIIDPISPLMAMSGVDSNDNDMARVVLEQLGEIRAAAGLRHLIIVDHTGHSDKTRARGASAKEDWADMIWNVIADQDGVSAYRTLTALGRGVLGEQTYCRQGGKLRAVTSRNQEPERKKAGAETTEGTVIRELKKGARTVAQLAATAGVTPERVRQILKGLEERGSVQQKGKNKQAEIWNWGSY